MQNLIDLSSLTEKELLILVLDRMSRYDYDIKDMKDRLTLIENTMNTQKGFFQGLNWIKTIILSLPPGVLGVFIGREI